MIHFKLRDFIFLFLILLPTFVSGQSDNTGSSSFINPGADTLYVGYTYWWPESGPFIGTCGIPYALVFTGLVQSMGASETAPTGLYSSKPGVIEIEEILKLEGVGKATYSGQKIFVSDCFEHADVEVGDTVLVFCYEYEGSVSIPGSDSILKIEGLADPAVTSIKKYVAAGQEASAIADDIPMWEERGLGAALRQIIACEESGYGR